MFYLFFSKEDRFSMNIYNLYKDLPNVRMVDNFLNLTQEDISELGLKATDEILVVSKHKSKHDHNMITIHYTGNFNNAELGGNSYSMNRANISMFRQIFDKIKELRDPRFMIEATHHGPTLSNPTVFFEIGPNDESYESQNNIDIYSNILEEIIESYELKEEENVSILIGAEHYISKEYYDRIIEKIKSRSNLDNITLGHIMPKYALVQLLDNPANLELMINDMVEKSNAKYIIVDKSYVKSFTLIKEICEKIKKEKDIEFISLK